MRPQTLRRRARQLAGLLGVDAIDDVARRRRGSRREHAAPNDAADTGKELRMHA